MISVIARELANDKSERELLAMKAYIERRAKIEIDQLNEALDLVRTRDAKKARGRRLAARGHTRRRILEAVHDYGEATPSDVIQQMSFDRWGAPNGGSVYTMMARMAKDGELVRVSNGRYAPARPLEAANADTSETAPPS